MRRKVKMRMWWKWVELVPIQTRMNLIAKAHRCRTFGT